MLKPSAQLARSLEDVQTELLIQTFSDRILVLITQVGKVGSLFQASIPPTASLRLPSNVSFGGSEPSDPVFETPQWLPTPSPSIQLTPLLGSAPTERYQTLYSLYASQAATLVWFSVKEQGAEVKPVVVGIALKKMETSDETKERKTFMDIMHMLKELLSQTSDS